MRVKVIAAQKKAAQKVKLAEKKKIVKGKRCWIKAYGSECAPCSVGGGPERRHLGVQRRDRALLIHATLLRARIQQC